MITPRLRATIDKLVSKVSEIPEQRRRILKEMTHGIADRSQPDQIDNLTFICTHNSRRSIIAQVWAQAAAHYYGVSNVHCFSGGTEATAFNVRAVDAMEEAGFDIRTTGRSENPAYEIIYATDVPPLSVYSKVYDDAANPQNDFVAIMTCAHADQNCPLVPGASKRVSLPYDDPKDFDGTDLEEIKYRERVAEIGREMLFAFSGVARS
jgi:protein-tyrosine-phosphatase